jgi:hypothetical protein
MKHRPSGDHGNESMTQFDGGGDAKNSRGNLCAGGVNAVGTRHVFRFGKRSNERIVARSAAAGHGRGAAPHARSTGLLDRRILPRGRPAGFRARRTLKLRELIQMQRQMLLTLCNCSVVAVHPQDYPRSECRICTSSNCYGHGRIPFAPLSPVQTNSSVLQCVGSFFFK